MGRESLCSEGYGANAEGSAHVTTLDRVVKHSIKLWGYRILILV